MSTTPFTRPEKGAAFHEARRLRARITDDGGCCYCTRRCPAFDTIGRRALCGLTPPKQFPACVDHAVGFELDEETL